MPNFYQSGSPVLPIYKYGGYMNEKISNAKRGRDNRDLHKDLRHYKQRNKDNSKIIQDRPFG